VSDVKSDCLGGYHASRTSGTRLPLAIRLIVLHDTEGGTAESVARYFASDKAKGSAHLVVDDRDCYRTLRNDEIPWGAPGANRQGFHIEQVGFARWSAPIWINHVQTLRRAAYKTAFH
jgi:N-acetylmuramoyl-L-alanine amidase CwlA